jgi:hypothetical protein
MWAFGFDEFLRTQESRTGTFQYFLDFPEANDSIFGIVSKVKIPQQMKVSIFQKQF